MTALRTAGQRAARPAALPGRRPRARHVLPAAAVALALLLAGCATQTGEQTAGTASTETMAEDGSDGEMGADDASPDGSGTAESGAAESGAAGSGTDAAGSGSADDAMAAGDVVLSLSAPDLTGTPTTIELAGPAVLWFWAPWCPNCRAEAPDVAAVADSVTVVGIAGRDELDAMRDFVTETGTGGFAHLADLDGALWQEFGVSYQPAYVFIDADGEQTLYLGTLGEDALRQRIAEL